MNEDLMDFIKARLADDEQAAQAAEESSWRCEPDGGADYFTLHLGDPALNARAVVDIGSGYDDLMTVGDATHIARHDPARALRDVAAKRRITDEHASEGETCRTCTVEDREVRWDGENEEVAWMRRPVAAPCQTLRLLAEVYDRHPDYQASWRPDVG